MTITVNDDLTTLVISEDGLRECLLPPYNPETLIRFLDKAEAEAFARTIIDNPNYFIPRLSDEEKQAQRDDAARQQNVARAKQELLATDWIENASVRDSSVVPYLENFAAFDAYRLALRAIAVTKPVTVENWPEAPANQWKVQA